MDYAYGISIVAAVLGLIMGSYAGATVWRLRARQLTQDDADLWELTARSKNGDELSGDEASGRAWLEETKAERSAELKHLKSLAGVSVKDDRSQCLSCGHALRWYDLIPLASWISTKGKCRYCKAPIGRFEPLMELGTATVFSIFTFFWVTSMGLAPVAMALLGLWLAALTMLVILFAYDLKWFLLPDRVMFPLIALSLVITFLTLFVSEGGFDVSALGSVAASVTVLGGLYFLLWFISKGRWVGFGDVKLGIALGILLIDWRLALLTLFLANLIGTLVVLPGLITKKLSRTTQVPFGPFLIVGFFVSLVWGDSIIAGYQTFSTWLSTTMLML